MDMQRGLSRGNTLDDNPQRRHVRREGRILPRPVGDEGRRRPSEPQSIERGSVLCDNGELRVTDTGCNYKRINHLASAESALQLCRPGDGSGRRLWRMKAGEVPVSYRARHAVAWRATIAN